MDPPDKVILVISQVYVPDPASVGQHMADAAAEMARRGWNVRVLTSARGYDDPSRQYAAHETRDGVRIDRLPLSSFGKGSVAARLAGQLLFLFQCFIHGILMGRISALFVTTSPPLTSLAAVPLSILKRAPLKYWVMDVNPDQMIELGKLSPAAPMARMFNFLNRRILRRAELIVALDRFMAERLLKKADIADKLEVMPPWPHDEHLEALEHDANPFRAEHKLTGKFVFMYSGNHGFSTPIKTILDAALRMRDRDDIVFMFIGGGVRKQEVKDIIAAHGADNIRDLPYQPLDQIRYSLSAADVHLVSVGDDVVGVVHPCKVYGAMAVARPILLLGPDPCHISDLIRKHDIGWHIHHGDIEQAERTLRAIADTRPARLHEMGQRARAVITEHLSQRMLTTRFCDLLERRDAGRASPPIREHA